MDVYDHAGETAEMTAPVAVVAEDFAAKDDPAREEARRQAQELIARFGLGRKDFSWRKTLGVGALARELILRHPEWDNATIADEVRSRLNSRTTPRCIGWYARAMKVARPRRPRSN